MNEPLFCARAVHFAATILTAGVVFFLIAIAEPAFRQGQLDGAFAVIVRRRLARIAWIGLVLAVLSATAWLVLIAASMSGEPLAEVVSGNVLWTVLASTDFGNDWLARGAVTCLLAAAFIAFLSPAVAKPAWLNAVAVILAAALVGSLAFAGHAIGGQGSEAVVHPTADVLHLLAAAAWVGTLLPLAVLLAAARRDGASLAVVRAATLRFSTLGMVSVGTLLVTGTVNTWYLVGGIAALTGSDYGRLLIAKIALFLGMVAIAAVNRLYLTPRIVGAADAGGAQPALRQLCRNAAAEAAAGTLVIVIVAALGIRVPAIHAAHHHTAAGIVPADASFQHIHTEQGMADVTIEPGHVGTADVTIRLWNDNEEPLAAQSVTLTLTPPASGSQPITRTATLDSEGAWRVDGVALSQAGNWTVTVDAALEPNRRLVLTAPIVIDPR